jgi:alkaline phosphatase
MTRRRSSFFVAAILLAASLLAAPALADAERFTVSVGQTGNAIFIHPDGTALNHWNAARMYWYGADAVSPWDALPFMSIYRGHMSDQLGGTSNGGATAHAFGVKVQGPDSYGTDRGRDIDALSGYPGSILREAASKGHPVGIINDGDINGEPGTGAFLAETDNRGQPNDHALQILGGRPGFDGGTPADITDGEPDPLVVLGGGERFFLPEGTPRCTTAPTLEEPRLECYVHARPEDFGGGPARDDGRNLLQEAAADGWTVLRTRAEFDAFFERVRNAEPGSEDWAPKVLGLFAADDIFNDEEEEKLQDPNRVPTEGGLVRSPGDPLPPEGEEFGAEKIGPLVLWGPKFEDPRNPFGFDPPTIAELTELGLLLLERKADMVGKPFAAVIEVESTDNMPNQNNAIGTLRALERANDTIEVASNFQKREGAFANEGDEKTLIVTAADSDGSGLQVLPLRSVAVDTPFNPLACDEPANDGRSTCAVPSDPPLVTQTTVNPEFSSSEVNVFVDGIAGRGTEAFRAAPDALAEPRSTGDPAFGDYDESGRRSFGGGTVTREELLFAIAWSSIPDTAGAIVTRAQGLNAYLLADPRPFTEGEPPFHARFDNTDIYRLMYLTLFGERLPSAVGKTSPSR